MAGMAATLEDRIERLSAVSLNRVIEPDEMVPGHVGDGAVLPPELLSIDGLGVDIQSPDGKERITAGTTIWAAGVQASPLAAQLAEASGAETDRAGRMRPLPPRRGRPAAPRRDRARGR